MPELNLKALLGWVLVLASTSSFCVADTDLRDVEALSNLYISLDFPALEGWIPIGGDPCGDHWQGVFCVFSNVTQLMLNNSNLGGTLGESLDFPSVLQINFSDNHIGGHIPSVLPSTLTSLLLSNNAMKGAITDAFDQLISLQQLDLSNNGLSGPLPPSMGNMTSLNFLYLQNNELTGLLDVLQDLPLSDLNIENNLFSGPIPPKLLNLPNFRKDGNPFNTTPAPSSPPALPPFLAEPPYAGGARPPYAQDSPRQQPNGPSVPGLSDHPKSGKLKESSRTNVVTLTIVAGIVAVVVLGMCVLMPIFCRKRPVKRDAEALPADKGNLAKPNQNVVRQQENGVEKEPKEPMVRVRHQHGLDDTRPKPHLKTMTACSKHEMNTEGMDVKPLPLAPFPPLRIPAEACSQSWSARTLNSSCSSLRVFTIAELQQYTNSFSEGNFVGEGMLGSVYRAKLPDGMLLAVKKLKRSIFGQHPDDEFLQLISNIANIHHANILGLVGYCNEYGQQLLVYEYCQLGSLHDALHVDDEVHKKLMWNARVRLALGAARALQYLHEACQPPVVHQNFRSANILLDDKLAARVSDCGFGSFWSSSSNGISGFTPNAQGYSAPELELGSYTCKSNVYSFGVVMLELLTGRKSYDRSQSRGAQSLVRWAVPRLHDIDALSRMVDPSLKGSYPMKSVSRFADIISRCIQLEPEFRPPISEIVQDLLQMV